MLDPTLLKAFITMLAAVVGLSLLLFILKKRIAIKGRVASNPSSLYVDARVPLTPKSQAIVLLYGEKRFLIGVTENSVNLIADISDTEQKIHSDKPNDKKVISEETDILEPQLPEDLSFTAFLKSISRRES